MNLRVLVDRVHHPERADFAVDCDRKVAPQPTVFKKPAGKFRIAIDQVVDEEYLPIMHALLDKHTKEEPQVFRDGSDHDFTDKEHENETIELKTWYEEDGGLVQCYVDEDSQEPEGRFVRIDNVSVQFGWCKEG